MYITRAIITRSMYFFNQLFNGALWLLLKTSYVLNQNKQIAVCTLREVLINSRL